MKSPFVQLSWELATMEGYDANVDVLRGNINSIQALPLLERMQIIYNLQRAAMVFYDPLEKFVKIVDTLFCLNPGSPRPVRTSYYLRYIDEDSVDGHKLLYVRSLLDIQSFARIPRYLLRASKVWFGKKRAVEQALLRVSWFVSHTTFKNVASDVKRIDAALRELEKQTDILSPTSKRTISAQLEQTWSAMEFEARTNA